MNRAIILLSTLLLPVISWGQSKNNEFNFGFEKSNLNGKLPDQWVQWGSGFQLKIDTVTKYQGKTSVQIESIGKRAPDSFGCVAYAIPSKYEAKEIEVRAYMKLDNVADGPIGLMIRVDGASGTLGFENMQSENIQGTRDWSLYTVKIPYPDNARTIYIGAILSGNGQLWVDNFQVLLDGKDISEAKTINPKELKADSDKEFEGGSRISGIELTPSKIENLDILGKIWGYLKYYHPSVAAGEYNWDSELFRILPKIIASKNQEERNEILNSWVLSLGDFEVMASEGKIVREIKLSPDLSWINPIALGPELANSLNKIKSARRLGEHYYIGKVAGVGNPVFKNERPYSSVSYPDTGFRLLSLYRYWNMITYYFPDKHLIGEDWNTMMGEFIPRFVNAGNELDYKISALSLIARIHDTHANISGTDKALSEYRGQKYAALQISFVENKAVVIDYFDKERGEKTGIKIGDIIEKIDNKNIDDIIQEKLPLTPASNYPTQLRDIAKNLLRTNNPSLDITYRNGKRKVSTKIESFTPTEINVAGKYQKKDTCFRMINSDIAYLFPGSIKRAYLPRLMTEINKAKGLIIDFRCYPSDFIVFSLGEYLLPEAKSFVKFSNGSIESPGLFTLTEEVKIGKSNPDYYKGKIVIMVNEVTVSSAEYHTMAFRTAPRAKVIGSTTAGADGNVSRIVLPGGITTMISGIGVYYPDGKETQRIGIIPDQEVKPTVQGIKNGKDELLEMAIKMINDQ